jgi:hypothetical protein
MIAFIITFIILYGFAVLCGHTFVKAYLEGSVPWKIWNHILLLLILITCVIEGYRLALL